MGSPRRVLGSIVIPFTENYANFTIRLAHEPISKPLSMPIRYVSRTRSLLYFLQEVLRRIRACILHSRSISGTQ